MENFQFANSKAQTSNLQTSKHDSQFSNMSHGKMCVHTNGANFHTYHMAVNVPCMLHGVKCLHTYHMVVNVSYISHSGKCLHTCHLPVNVSMHVTLWSMSPQISQSGKCLHACHMAVNFQTNFHDTNFQNVCSVKQTFNLQTFIT